MVIFLYFQEKARAIIRIPQVKARVNSYILEKGPCPVFTALLIIEIVIKRKLKMVTDVTIILLICSDFATFLLFPNFCLKKYLVKIIWKIPRTIDKPRLIRPVLKLKISRFILNFPY